MTLAASRSALEDPTTHALMILANRIACYLSKGSLGRAILFLDIKKAYDSMWWNGLIYKLIQLGVPNCNVKFIKIWLENRYVYARSGNKSYAVYFGPYSWMIFLIFLFI